MPRSRLLPIAFTSAESFERELRAIFERSWVHVADITDVPDPGSYVPATIGRTPVLVMRGHDGEVRAFLNACPHRGATLAEEPGRCEKLLRCPYHAWSFETDGTLRGVPFKEEFDCDLSDRNLVPVRVAILGPMIFGCLDGNAPDFQKWSGELGAAFARASFPRWEQAFQFDYEVKANWKAYVENGLEGYHIPAVHDFLRDAIDLNSGTNYFEDHSSYTLVDASTMLAGDMPVQQIRFGHLFPNLIPVLSPIDFSYLRIDPVGPETIRLRGRGFDAGPDTFIPREVRAMGFDMTNRQDIAVVERVQRGLRARGLPQAVHSGLHEARVTHFEKMIEYALSA